MLRSGLDSGESVWTLARKRRWMDALEVLGAAPWLWVVTSVCPVGAGVLASFYPTRIQSGIQPFLLPGMEFDLIATAFWMSIVIAGASFGLGQWSQSQANEALRMMVRRLQTLPPGGFLNFYQRVYGPVARNAELVTLNEEATREDTEQAIRNVLGTIAELARNFDEQDAATYSANLMLYRSAGVAFECTEPIHLAPYSPLDPAVRGYLELVVSLSTTTQLQSRHYAPDPQAVAIVLPVPVNSDRILDENKHHRDPVMPGAPQAFLRHGYVGFESVEAYLRWLDEHSSRGLEVVNPLKNHVIHGAGCHMKSFGSRPVMDSKTNGSAAAVLNIHSDREGLLRDGGQTLFAPLIEPLCYLLGVLLEKREVIRYLEVTEAIRLMNDRD